MALELPSDFKEFLKLLNAHGVRYLLVGGYAVGYHGYPRATGVLDVWVAVEPVNALHIVDALREFGFDIPELTVDLFLQDERMVRMGAPPIRIEILTAISGVSFDQCYVDRVVATIEGIEIPFISLEHLKTNKQASGRHKDLSDLEHLP